MAIIAGVISIAMNGMEVPIMIYLRMFPLIILFALNFRHSISLKMCGHKARICCEFSGDVVLAMDARAKERFCESASPGEI